MNKKAFTLIELLVVVLIIGILAAVALPQYEKAVVKSQAAQAQILLKSIGNAVDAYMLANNKMPNSFDDLDIALPADFNGTEACSTYTNDVHSNGKWAISLESHDELNAFNAIWMCQLSGKYRGAGFGIQVTKPADASHVTREIVCAEFSTFTGSQGDFCTKLFATSNIVGSGAVTSFRLP